MDKFLYQIQVNFAIIVPARISVPLRQNGRLPDVLSESVLKPEPPVCRYLLPDCIDYRKRSL